MSSPLVPHTPSESTSSGRPVMLLLELLGRKQTLRILWELNSGPLKFRALQQRCGGISPTVLNRRLADMRSAAVVEHIEKQGYQLTDEGILLLQLLGPLQGWAERWASRGQNSDA